MPSYPATNLKSYANLLEAAAYLADSARGADWESLDPDSQSRALISATRLLDRQRWEGTASGLSTVSSVVITAGGSSYVAGVRLTVQGGTTARSTVVEVLTVSSGAVATVRVIDAGLYSALPTSPASTVSSGVGSGCTLTLTSSTQPLQLPHSGMTDRYGTSVLSTTVPQEVADACMELAFRVSQDSSLEGQASTASDVVKRAAAGSAEVENFAPGAFVSVTRFPPEVTELIAPFLAAAGGSVVGSQAFGTDAESQFDDCDRSELTEGF
jgi:hypothetical protein